MDATHSSLVVAQGVDLFMVRPRRKVLALLAPWVADPAHGRAFSILLPLNFVIKGRVTRSKVVESSGDVFA
jgi:hypothetical protein